MLNKLDRYMTNPANFEQIAKDWAQVFNTHLAANRVDMLTSELINRNIIQILYMLADTILTPELLTDRDALRVLCNMNVVSTPLAKTLVLTNRAPHLNLVFKYADENKTPEHWFKAINDDIMVFCCWAIWHGGSGESIRRNIASKAQRKIRIIDQQIGVDGILTVLERAIAGFNGLREKLFLPTYRTLTTQSYSDNTVSFNTIQWR